MGKTVSTSAGRKKTAKRSTRVETVARDIKEYFHSHPDAGDTAEGITDWWVARQRLSNATPLVRQALDYLVDQGELRKRKYGGREIYMRGVAQ